MRKLVCGAAVLAAACLSEDADRESVGASSAVVVPLVPVSDVAATGLVGEPEVAGLYADLDDGTSYAAADDAATSVRTVDGRRTGTLTSGYGASPPGRVTDVVVHVRARRDATARKGTIQVKLYGGETLLGTGPRHALGSGWADLDDGFHGLSVGGVEELRTELVLDNASRRARGTLRATSLWIDATIESCTPTSCTAEGASCGTIEDGCGGTLDCGVCPPPGSSSDVATTGPVTIRPTFRALGVTAALSGDADGDGRARIQFRRTGSSTWLDAYAPQHDRRQTIDGAPNPYRDQARVSVVGLTAATSYEVRVTWVDPDGVTGPNPVVATTSTLSLAPPTGGGTVDVTDDATLAAALATVTPGQTIRLAAGPYRPFAIDRSGTSDAWIVLEGDAGGGTIVSGAGVDQNVLVDASYVVVQRLTLGPSDRSGIVVGGGAHHVFVRDNVLRDVSARCASDPSGHYDDVGIWISGDDVYVLGNAVSSPSLASPACALQPAWYSPGSGIAWGDVTTLVVADNVVAGGFRDAIVSDSSWNLGVNVDLVGNTVRGYRDDGVESKGGNVNVRLWENHIEADEGDSCIAGNTNTTTNRYGPLYIFRNTCRVTTSNPDGATIFKLGGVETVLFHNSVDASGAAVRWDGFVSGPDVALNNIVETAGSAINYGLATAVFDYDIYWSLQSSFAYRYGMEATYDTLADFRAATGQEQHGLLADPVFTDTALHLGAASPAVDAALAIPNFNGPDSAWPVRGLAPDIGAHER